MQKKDKKHSEVLETLNDRKRERIEQSHNKEEGIETQNCFLWKNLNEKPSQLSFKLKLQERKLLVFFCLKFVAFINLHCDLS